MSRLWYQHPARSCVEIEDNNNIKQKASSKNNRKNKMIKTQLLNAKTFRLKSSSVNLQLRTARVIYNLNKIRITIKFTKSQN